MKQGGEENGVTATKTKAEQGTYCKPNKLQGVENEKEAEREKMSIRKRSSLEAHYTSQNSASVPIPFVSLSF